MHVDMERIEEQGQVDTMSMQLPEKSEKQLLLETGYKFCPGIKCKVVLPVSNFGLNCNMDDGYDIYCNQCNRRKRQSRSVFYTDRRNSVTVPDSFELFCIDNPQLGRHRESEDIFGIHDNCDEFPVCADISASFSRSDPYANNSRPLDFRMEDDMRQEYSSYSDYLFRNFRSKRPGCRERPSTGMVHVNTSKSRDEGRKKMVLDKIKVQTNEFKVRNKLFLFQMENKVYDSLFRNRRLMCIRTNKPLTEDCFLDHHQLDIDIIEDESCGKRRLEVKCDGCFVQP